MPKGGAATAIYLFVWSLNYSSNGDGRKTNRKTSNSLPLRKFNFNFTCPYLSSIWVFNSPHSENVHTQLFPLENINFENMFVKYFNCCWLRIMPEYWTRRLLCTYAGSGKVWLRSKGSLFRGGQQCHSIQHDLEVVQCRPEETARTLRLDLV